MPTTLTNGAPAAGDPFVQSLSESDFFGTRILCGRLGALAGPRSMSERRACAALRFQSAGRNDPPECPTGAPRKNFSQVNRIGNHVAGNFPATFAFVFASVIAVLHVCQRLRLMVYGVAGVKVLRGRPRRFGASRPESQRSSSLRRTVRPWTLSLPDAMARQTVHRLRPMRIAAT